ncbi:ArsR/SmtB family transcription factor [Sphingobium indicum]|nr:metalloregulator ArsR/SmtB family transcription factor [Sphingobium indicum]
MEKINALQVLSALSVETRFDAVKLLSVVGSDGLPAGELARRLGVRQNTLSDHLAVLTRSGILSSERQSRSIIYRFNPMVLQSLNAFLTRALAQN